MSAEKQRFGVIVVDNDDISTTYKVWTMEESLYVSVCGGKIYIEGKSNRKKISATYRSKPRKTKTLLLYIVNVLMKIIEKL